MDIIQLILALIGALAWTPIIMKYFCIKKRKITCCIVDYDILTNAKGNNSNYSNSKKGSILVLGLNLFIVEKSYFAENYSISTFLKNGTTAHCEIIDGEIVAKVNKTGCIKSLNYPQEYNFNLHREVIHDKDNVRIIPLLVENISSLKIEEIKNIDIQLENGKEKKIIKITEKDFPVFNQMKFISGFYYNENIGDKVK